MKVQVRNNGTAEWFGFDFDGAELRASPGAVVQMTEERAARLLADYPGRFEVLVIAELVKPETEPDKVEAEPPAGDTETASPAEPEVSAPHSLEPGAPSTEPPAEQAFEDPKKGGLGDEPTGSPPATKPHPQRRGRGNKPGS